MLRPTDPRSSPSVRPAQFLVMHRRAPVRRKGDSLSSTSAADFVLEFSLIPPTSRSLRPMRLAWRRVPPQAASFDRQLESQATYLDRSQERRVFGPEPGAQGRLPISFASAPCKPGEIEAELTILSASSWRTESSSPSLMRRSGTIPVQLRPIHPKGSQSETARHVPMPLRASDLVGGPHRE
jgi:hypothetical protein